MKLCWLPLAASILAVVAASTVEFRRTRLSPVTRIVDLLKGIANKVDEEQEKEESHFKDFKCWASTVISAKTESNAKAAARVESLETYVADIEAGRIEFTTERVDLEKEIASLTSDIESATAAHQKEVEDFAAAKDDMKKAMEALGDAIEVLGKATGGSPSSLLLLRSNLQSGAGLESEAASAQLLERAYEVGKRYLSATDSLFLRRILTGDVPLHDQKKLNRKADFKMRYKARSGKIQKVLAQLLDTFTASLADTTSKQAKTVKAYEDLTTAKKAQKMKAEEALDAMLVENGARGMSKAEAQTELSQLKAQILSDKAFITRTEKDMQNKQAEWDQRDKTRQDELKAISQAISILHSDESKDLFKKSFASQGYSLFQSHSQTQSFASISRSAAITLDALGVSTADHRANALAKLASSATTRGNFDKVIAAIDMLVSTLKTEEQEDLFKKEQCEQTRADDAKSAQVLSRDVDEKTDAILRLANEIAQFEMQIDEMNLSINNTQDAQQKATVIRQDENAAFLGSKKEDEEAVTLVGKAIAVLRTFYEGSVALEQQSQQPEVVAGEAPPPPSTWESPYAGKQEESQGIIAILTLLEEDIKKDIAAAVSSEASAVAAYDVMMEETNAQIASLRETITALQGDIADKAASASDLKGEKRARKDELKALIKKMKDMAPGCDFITVNYSVRANNRQVEIDGLVKAKAILQKARFSTPPS
mmetsp:Transcript_47449/g.103125  ORF Transcript_47449/g.103125 Transcript_47449/m.103125 type:complete len:712 (-) Transcript_47449:50-2185(-)